MSEDKHEQLDNLDKYFQKVKKCQSKRRQADLSAAIRSSADKPSVASLFLGKRITGMPLSLAYSAPPQSTIPKN